MKGKKTDWALVAWWGGLAILFWIRNLVMLDPDYGQHLATGRLIWERGIPLTDPFSYTMPSFPYIDHAWLTDVGMYWGERLSGKVGLAGIFAAAAVGALAVAMRGVGVGGMIVPVGLGVTVLLGRAGVRPQVLDWLGLAVVLEVAGGQDWKRWRWAAAAFFAAWANLHGGWPIGLAAAGICRLAVWIEKRKIDWGDVAAGILAVLGVAANPYGWGLIREVWETAGDGNLRWSVAEWQPFWGVVDLGFWGLLAIGVGLAGRYWGRINKGRVAVAGVLAVMGISSLRHMALFVIAVMPLVALGWEQLGVEAENRGTIERWNVLSMWMRRVVALLAAITLVEVAVGTWQLREEGFYPKRVISWLKNRSIQGRVLTSYGWGSYQMWKWPEQKTFVDGRMPSWGNDQAADGESKNAFEEFAAVSRGSEGWEDVLTKYDVGVVIWPVVEETEKKAIFEITVGKKPEKKKKLGQRLAELGWEKVYEDAIAVVYEK